MWVDESTFGKRLRPVRMAIGGVIAVVLVSATSAAGAPLPFADNNGLIPPKSAYGGPFFSLSRDWPAAPPPPLADPPWVKAIQGKPIDVSNAAAYVQALKDYAGPNAKQLIWNYDGWNAGSAGWYNQPWLGSIREAIHGMYKGSEFDASLFPNTGLKTAFTTYVLTYYDQRAAYTVGKVWGATAMDPKITTANAQFLEGAVIVKAAFVNVTGTDWDAMNGAATWPLYVPIPTSAKSPPPAVTTSSFMQFDIIVKDSQSSPKTGWVFSTLVYDAAAAGQDWDKMVPLGVMWGNDPGVNSAKNPKAPLQETWINPAAPLYATETLGWGGRLSGPNDGATNDIMVAGKVFPNAPDSSCMSCHSPAEWKMKSFLLPSFPNKKPPPPFQPCGKDGDYICSPPPGSATWMSWFQDRPGTQPKDPGTVALDYDMVFAFKSLPAWASAMGTPVPLMLLPSHVHEQPELQYNGVPVKRKTATQKKHVRKVPFTDQ